MKLRSHQTFTLLLLGTLIVVSLNAWLAFRSVSTLTRNQNLVEHTWQVITQVERLMGYAKDAETGSRGFLIAGDPAYLEPYIAAQRALPTILDQLRSLTLDNPSQQQRIAQVRDVLSQRLVQLQHLVDLRRNGSTADSPRSLALVGTGKESMDRLRGLGDDMEREERRLLVLRVADARDSSRRARYSIALASGLDLLLILFGLGKMLQESRLRVIAELAGQRLTIAHAETQARADEVRALNAHLEERVVERTAELERINKELEAFSYSVSHDLRAPLRTIDGFSLALEEDFAEVVDDTGRDYIRRVRSSVQRMGQLIDALLLLSRITRAEISREQFDLTRLAETVAAEIQEQNAAQPITFQIEPGMQAFADPRLVRVALENLLGNAVKFSSRMQQPILQFSWDVQEKAWRVKDNGAGFDMIYANRLFSAFNRLHGDKDFKGSGIGLATVSRVVERHRGRIWAKSVVDQGATFWFTLGEES